MIIFNKIISGRKYTADEFLNEELVREEFSPKLPEDCIRPLVKLTIYFGKRERDNVWVVDKKSLIFVRITLKRKEGRFIRVYKDWEDKVRQFFDTIDGNISKIQLNY